MRIKNACRCLLTLGMLILSLKVLTDFMERKNSDFKYRPFFEQKEDFDILFFGSSHVINGIFPMELWNDYGLVSYNFGGHANTLATSYWMMENVFDYTNPKLVVVDCLGLGNNAKTGVGFSNVHLSFDAFPLNFTKCSAVFDLLNDDLMKTAEDIDQRTKMSLLWDYSVYHSRWNELSSSDFNMVSSREKGAESRIAVSVPVEITDVPSDKKLEGDRTSIDYLCKMIEECESRGIEILLLYLPFPAPEGYQMEANRGYDIAKKYDVNYINFLDMDIVDYSTDCYDPSSHLNPSGARKVTDYLGRYISDHYDIPDQRENTDYSSWHRDYNDYKDFKARNLQNLNALDVYLMLMADKNYNAFIEIRDSSIWENGYYCSLFNNIGIDSKKIGTHTDCVLVQAAGMHVDTLDNFDSCKSIYQTALGEVRCERREDGGRSVYLNDEVLYNVAFEEDENIDVHIVVFDKNSMEIVDQVGFIIQGKDDINITDVIRY